MPPLQQVTSPAVVAHELPGTDLTRWRLKCKEGRQHWHYLETDEECHKWPQTNCDRYWLGLPLDLPDSPPATNPLDAAQKGIDFCKHLQTEDGHFAGEYGGPLFLMPGMCIAHYVTQTPIPDPWRQEMIRYLVNVADAEQGGWGLHIEGHSTVFGTACNYVALRILGLSPDHPTMVKARANLHRMGGAVAAPSWGKFWLSVMNVYSYEGMNPVPPELWLLPESMPFHPSRYWVHTRMVYLPMGYLYGKKYQCPETQLIRELRQELYVQPYEDIYWPAARNDVAEEDSYIEHHKLLDLTYAWMNLYEKHHSKSLREKALKHVYNLILMEEENTGGVNLGPVNKAMDMIILWLEEGPDSKLFKLQVKHYSDYMWVSDRGMMNNGTDGSQLWDTAFFAQAICESGLAEKKENHEIMLRALDFIDDCQIKDHPVHYKEAYRQLRKGAWPFSTRHQGYTVSDCTAEGLKAALCLMSLSYTPNSIPEQRIFDAVNVLLSMQNSDGGFASYEDIRGPKLLEIINPAEVFADIMIEYSYVECSTAVLLSLSYFRKRYPDYRTKEIQNVQKSVVKFIKSKQRADGSWFGSWGICFTYAGMFAIDSLTSVDETYANSKHVRKGCDFLISKQMKDGGWGESYKSCETGEYVHTATSQVVQTSWAVLALMAAKYPDQEPIRRGIKLIMQRQQLNGEWLQENIEGIFNKNCAISYPNYKFSFTIWALGRYARIYGNADIL
ncbi:terpenoid cyclases/protein prenyltransferase alpha-alpha toroid [Thamnocephalis sphaerospora]|uniref:Terpene cyclase/mutase family member n=1 Tax=Thamnocephalis sphaerospora TaxID=78915 RepID=A0A4P9XXS6_9FUNG|nr:terpenoid cyclases/protein prenyltransferase alpha-alpha toroid [Thamnocephalis sphaerospora]|eukprot:RKP10862.1 terpenoid cyclases/protein prenyltransferase alpha-alpha toroid [Thamnocephalis sphaerospora]